MACHIETNLQSEKKETTAISTKYLCLEIVRSVIP